MGCRKDCVGCAEFPCPILMHADLPRSRKRVVAARPSKQEMLQEQVLRAAEAGVSAYEAGATLAFIGENANGEPSSPQTCGGYFDADYGTKWRDE